MRAKPVTVPHSPAFALKHRVRMPIEVPEEPEVRSKQYCTQYTDTSSTCVAFRNNLIHR